MEGFELCTISLFRDHTDQANKAVAHFIYQVKANEKNSDPSRERKEIGRRRESSHMRLRFVFFLHISFTLRENSGYIRDLMECMVWCLCFGPALEWEFIRNSISNLFISIPRHMGKFPTLQSGVKSEISSDMERTNAGRPGTIRGITPSPGFLPYNVRRRSQVYDL